MAAQAKTVHTLKPADVLAEAPHLHAAPPPHPRHDPIDRRRLNVSEKLAEGRGFWRGVFVGASLGAVAGVGGAIAVATVWVPLVLDTVQQSAMISTLHAGGAAGGALTVTPTGQAVPAEALPEVTGR